MTSLLFQHCMLVQPSMSLFITYTSHAGGSWFACARLFAETQMRLLTLLKVGMLTRYLRVVLDPLPYAMFWGHTGFWKTKANFYTPDGLHLNTRGQHKLYRSFKGAVFTPFAQFSFLGGSLLYHLL